MNSRRRNQEDASGGSARKQDAAGTGMGNGQSADEAGTHGEHYAMTQAARSVMHPEWHEPEWRFYYSAVHG
jgi:hypothetical protein